MTKYGRRYLAVREFTSYCKDLNIPLMPFNKELEHYEREGVLLPVARIIKPDDYVKRRKLLDRTPETYGQEMPDWEELERLFYRRFHSDAVYNSDWTQGKNEFMLTTE